MIWKIIKTAMIREDIKSLVELSQITGISYPTLTHPRKINPKSFRLFELAQLDKVLHFSDVEWLKMRDEL